MRKDVWKWLCAGFVCLTLISCGDDTSDPTDDGSSDLIVNTKGKGNGVSYNRLVFSDLTRPDVFQKKYRYQAPARGRLTMLHSIDRPLQCQPKTKPDIFFIICPEGQGCGAAQTGVELMAGQATDFIVQVTNSKSRCAEIAIDFVLDFQ